ncbi:MAG TPA: hypothetical protein VN721_01695 [Flavipsychrobacter sp.]|nr:hypothetical protein [Flavipsychrobacter sp.]
MLSNLLCWSKSQMEGAVVYLAGVNLLTMLTQLSKWKKTGCEKRHYPSLSDRCRYSCIDQDKKDALFSMTSGSTFGTNNKKGVGLGLLLCKEFMERRWSYRF